MLRPSSVRFADSFPPQGEATKWLTIFAEENEGTEFSAGKGKPLKEADYLFLKGGEYFPTEMPEFVLSRRFAPLSPKGKARARDDETAMCKTPKLQRTLEASKTRSVRISRRALTDSKQPSENANATQYCAAYNARIVTTIRDRSTTPYPTPRYRSTAFRNLLCGIFPQALRSGSRCRVPGRPAPA